MVFKSTFIHFLALQTGSENLAKVLRERRARARNYKVSVQMKMKVSANYGSGLCITVVVASRKQ